MTVLFKFMAMFTFFQVAIRINKRMCPFVVEKCLVESALWTPSAIADGVGS